MEQVVQRCCACLITGGAQGETGRDTYQPDLCVATLPTAEGWN